MWKSLNKDSLIIRNDKRRTLKIMKNELNVKFDALVKAVSDMYSANPNNAELKSIYQHFCLLVDQINKIDIEEEKILQKILIYLQLGKIPLDKESLFIGARSGGVGDDDDTFMAAFLSPTISKLAIEHERCFVVSPEEFQRFAEQFHKQLSEGVTSFSVPPDTHVVPLTKNPDGWDTVGEWSNPQRIQVQQFVISLSDEAENQHGKRLRQEDK